MSILKPVELIPAVSRSASENFSVIANQGIFGKDANPDARFYVNVTAASGTTPTLNININATVNGTNYTIGSFSQATSSPATETITINDCPHDIQIETTLAGTSPVFTFEVFMTR